MSYHPFYHKDRAPFLKHLHNLVINGFWQRDLEADDFEFLEYVKARGLANGSLPCSNVVLLEELEFWHLPYSIAPNIERRVGRPSRNSRFETDEQREMRQARSNAWHARRIIRENEKAIAAAELEREKREWEKAQQQRKVRELIADAEWEAAAPTSSSFGATVGRHHIPQWKLEEMGVTGGPVGRRRKSQRRMLREAAERKQAKREAAAIRMRRVRELIDAQTEERRKEKFRDLIKRARARKAEKQIREQVAREVREAAAAELARQRREAVIAEARRTVDRVNRLEREFVLSAYSPDSMKLAIMQLLNTSAPGQNWNVEEMMRALGCDNRDFMNDCLNDLVRSGRLRKVETVS